MPRLGKTRLLEALRAGVEKGYGYRRIWRMLKENGAEAPIMAVKYWYYKSFPERVRRRGRYLPRELRIMLYEKVLELRRQGLGYRRIKRRIEELYGVMIDQMVIAHWIRGTHTPFGGIRIPTIDFLKPSPELAYVIGVVTGDGYSTTNTKESGEYIVGARIKDKEFSEEFARCLGRIFQ